MKTSTLFLAVAAVAVASTSSFVSAEEIPLAGRDSHFLAAARRVNPAQPPQVTPFLEERQALGGGSGSTTLDDNTLQSISGYNPPASTKLTTPAVASGTILSAEQIPGYNETANQNSGAEMLLAGHGLAAIAGGAAAGAAYLLF